MSSLYPSKDNEFLAWYPLGLEQDQAGQVWTRRRAGYYVHIPFCTAICDYCGFAIEKLKGSNIESYLDALKMEIRRYADSGRLSNYDFVCGHFGGGTPSAIPAADLIEIKKLIADSFSVSPDAEVTVEVNPISFTLEKAIVYREGGVNRISFGVQSFQDRILKIIGRPHSKRDVEDTLEVIKTVGWDNYSLDVIYGAPGQTLDEVQSDLQRVVDSGAAHVSCFRLEIIPFTALKLREAAQMLPPRLSIELLNEMDDMVTQVLTGAGYREYGAFNFAKPGYESVHNSVAFVAPQGEYAGFGNSSYSYINGHVYCNYADIDTYKESVFAGKDPISRAKKASQLECMSRFFALGLKFFRTPRKAFIAEFGMEPEQIFGPVLEKLTESGMLRLEEDDYVLTRLGRHYINNVAKEFFTGDNKGQRQHAEFVPTITVEQIEQYSRHAGNR